MGEQSPSGKADRVDVAEDGTIHVVDYKTGRPDDYQQLSERSPDLGGTKLQLPVYGQAARAREGRPDAPVTADYWFATTKGGFARIGYQVTPEVLERVGVTLTTIVDGIDQGVFPAYPRASSTLPWVDCAYCDPDGLGVAASAESVGTQVERPCARSVPRTLRTRRDG